MTDKEKIKEDIESYKESMKGLEPHSDFRRGQLTAYNQILQFIDSLPEEPKCIYNRTLEERKESCKYCSAYCTVRIKEEPASEDLEEEIGKYTTNHLLKKRNHSIGVYHLTQKDCDDIAHHFAEWQREKGIKLEKIDDLEKFAQKWAYSNYHKELDEINCDCLYSGVKKGAEWQKQQDEELFSKDTWNYIEENYPNITEEEKLRLYDVSIKSRLAGANTIKQQMKEHINNIVSCLEEFLQPGFPIFKAGISKEITWLNSLIIKND